MSNNLLKINTKDNVAVAVFEIKKGDKLENLIALNDIKVGHKIALDDINEGAEIIKYGEVIGFAKANILTGELVHTHNVKTTLDGDFVYNYNPKQKTSTVTPTDTPTFMGYRRDNGTVGTRNDIWIIPTVGCVNKTAEYLAKVANEKGYEGVDNVIALTHPYGCSQMGDDHENTKNLLAALTKNPNAGGVFIISLGCENNTIDSFKTALNGFDSNKTAFIVTQECVDEFKEGMLLLDKLAANVSAERVLVPSSELVLGLKCGGSDAFSGITANPLLGALTDYHISLGGKAVLTEIPETFGAEHILMNNAKDEYIFEEIKRTVNDFKDYYKSNNQVVYENPSPGNKDGGITTLEEKSLGCITKGGDNAVTAVYGYAEPMRENEGAGLLLLNGPGNDIVATTALTAIGANIILFTTGRGTPLGGIVPTLKIATNSNLAKNKANWIDFDAGKLLDKSDLTLDDLARELYNEILQVASGKKAAKNEIYGYSEIAIWKKGVTL